MGASNRRNQFRNTVAWTTLWYDQDRKVHQGVVYDVSSRGAFVRPLGLDPADLTPGTKVQLVFVPSDGGDGDAIRPQAIVRWIGKNTRHGVRGFGLQFDREEFELANILNERNRSSLGLPEPLLKNALEYGLSQVVPENVDSKKEAA